MTCHSSNKIQAILWTKRPVLGDGPWNKVPALPGNGCGAKNQLAASSAALQDGEQTACDLPRILRVTICERARCLPHRKHDMVAAPNDEAAVKGEPDTLDL